MPYPASPANASPESLRRTRFQHGRDMVTVVDPSGCAAGSDGVRVLGVGWDVRVRSALDDGDGQADDATGADALGDGLLVSVHALLEQRLIRDPCVDPAIDDLRPGRLWLALGLRDLQEVDPLLLDVRLGD